MLAVVRDVSEQVTVYELLEQRVAERTREIAALYRADEALYRSLKLDDVLHALVDEATDILQADKTTVLVWDASHEHLVVGAARGFSTESTSKMVHGPGEGVTAEVARTGRSIVVRDALADPRVRHTITDPEGIRSLMHVPILTVSGEVFGVFGVNYCTPQEFTGEHERMLQALARRAALAIENARLYSQAQQVAALEERQKLARELHDSVSQALYGIALGARTARTLLERDPTKVAEPLDYVLSLAAAGLAEMRALIFELRPESLQSEGLVAALRKQAAAVQARHGLVVELALGDEPDLPLTTKEAFYRIAQEALHNTIKHAHAQQVIVSLVASEGYVRLDVDDDGQGFDPHGAFPGHLGLQSMRERAAAVGGMVHIESAPQRGTRVSARVRLTPGGG
jgi:signal transduction histidine kinase